MSKFAVLGHGVVGSGVVELFYKNKESIEKKAGTSMDVKYILDLRDFPDSPYADKFTKDFNVILNDDEVTAVAECMGGVEPAFTFIKKCLEKGKSVATSNKELVAEKGDILLKLAKEHNCNFFFEASVGGAIPIIRPLHKCLAGNKITAVAGILNGTTNFILTKMINDKMSFDEALALAQKLGYAERNPDADVKGYDACR
ncbi:MAG: homoserine dehydrogenase, partial [Ruminococcus sp.]